ncbi:MAG: FKBP-type peptidyl-prolyl cis-trans isomerase [Bacteroidota bacterium]
MKHFIYLSTIAVTLCSLVGCKPAFKETQSGLQYKIVRRGKFVKPQGQEYLLVAMRYENEKGEVLFDTADQMPPVALIPCKEEDEKDSQNGGMKEIIQRLRKGGLEGKMTFKVVPEKFFGKSTEKMTKHYRIDKGTRVVLHTKLERIMTLEQYEQWEKEQQQAKQERAAKQTQEDTQIIEKYLQDHKLEAQKTASGLYYAIEKPGKGSTPQSGNRVKVNYTGCLLDGKVFDTSVAAVAKEHGLYNAARTYEPIAFQLGAGQVIKGWDEGIGLLQKGSKAKLLIPSRLGYGSQGAGTTIPPNAVLLFDVELVDYQAE